MRICWGVLVPLPAVAKFVLLRGAGARPLARSVVAMHINRLAALVLAAHRAHVAQIAGLTCEASLFAQLTTRRIDRAFWLAGRLVNFLTNRRG